MISVDLKAGDRMTFTLMPDGVVLMRLKNKRVAELALPGCCTGKAEGKYPKS